MEYGQREDGLFKLDQHYTPGCLIINKDGKKTISFSKYEILFKKKINPIFITKPEFTQMLREKEENVGKQVLKKHIILYNPESFWGCVLNE